MEELNFSPEIVKSSLLEKVGQVAVNLTDKSYTQTQRYNQIVKIVESTTAKLTNLGILLSQEEMDQLDSLIKMFVCGPINEIATFRLQIIESQNQFQGMYTTRYSYDEGF